MLRALCNLPISASAIITLTSWNVPLAAQQADPHYHLVKRIVLDEAPAALLVVDSRRHRLYGGGDYVLSTSDDSVIGSLAPGLGHGYAIAADLHRGVTRRGAIFDLETLKVIKPGAKESGENVVYDSATHRAFVIDDTLSVIDVPSGRDIARVSIQAIPHSGVSDNRGHLYIDAVDSIVVFDAASLTINARWPLDGCGAGRGMAYDPAHERLFVSCDAGQVIVLDASSGRTVARLPIHQPAFELPFDVSTGLLFNPNGDGTMSVFHEDAPDHYTELTPVQTADAEAAGTVDISTHRLYLIQRKTPDHHMNILVLAP